MGAVKNILLRTVALPALLTAPALAADMAVKAPAVPPTSAYSWTGFYVGLNAGANWAYSGDPTTSASCAPLGFIGSYLTCADVPVVNAVGTGSLSANARFTGGVQAGYNWQINSTVVGVEADYDSFNVKASRTATGNYVSIPNQFTITNSVSANWLFTARGRLGWVISTNLLGYVTGGLAATHYSTANSFSDNIPLGGAGPDAGNWSAAATKLGWTVGAGAEYALNKSWSVRAEYLYVHFNSITASGIVANTGFAPGGYANAISTSTDLSGQIARAGINYRF
jgi:outer membrane immunogenic protein